MASRTLPGIGLTGYWDLGADAWNDSPDGGMDANLRKISVVTQLVVLSRVSTVPGSPTNGDIHIITGTVNEDDIAFRDNGSWFYLTPKTGWRAHDLNTNEWIWFNGSAWVKEEHEAAGGGVIVTRQVFTGLNDTHTLASYTWSKPANLLYADVEALGAGGTANYPSNTTFGSGGGYGRKLIAAADLGSTETVTVGGGFGTGTAYFGYSSSFGSHLTAGGGAAGGGAAGSATGADFVLAGGVGTTTYPGQSALSILPSGGYGYGGTNTVRSGNGLVIVTNYVAP